MSLNALQYTYNSNQRVKLLQWIPPEPLPAQKEAEEQIAIDMGEEYEQALNDATQEEIIDLAGQFLFSRIIL